MWPPDQNGEKVNYTMRPSDKKQPSLEQQNFRQVSRKLHGKIKYKSKIAQQ